MIEVSYQGDVRKQSPTERGFDSSRSPLKISLAADPEHYGLFSYTFPDNPTASRDLLVIPHKLGYAPAALVGIKDFGDNKFSLHYKDISVSESVSAYTDSTSFVIHYQYEPSFHVNVSGRRFDFRYFIFVENAS